MCVYRSHLGALENDISRFFSFPTEKEEEVPHIVAGFFSAQIILWDFLLWVSFDKSSCHLVKKKFRAKKTT